MQGDGDFRSEECTEIAKNSDIIITNPPFSLIAIYIPFLCNLHKDFIIIAPMTVVCRDFLFNQIAEQKIKIGYYCNSNPWFTVPFSNKKQKRAVTVLTTFSIDRGKPPIPLVNKDIKNYQRFVVYTDVINVDNVKSIPNYSGKMAVPITFLKYWNPDQFNLIGMIKGRDSVLQNGRRVFARIVIKIKQGDSK